ncbi:hypothetical protein JD969_11470 [Planctomycetota bacterium]|nr:hypothetical protein JD969_11470 [Planctomycetota bacterium]
MNMLKTKTMRLVALPVIGASMVVFSGGCATNHPESVEYADAEKRIAEIREEQKHRYDRYEYANLPGLAIEYEVFNNAFRARPSEPLGYYELYNGPTSDSDLEDPMKREEELRLEAEEEAYESQKDSE